MELYKEHINEAMCAGDFYIGTAHRTQKGEIVSPHWHDFYEILYILQGTVKQTIDDTDDILTAGDIVVIQPGRVHKTSMLSTECKIIVVMFMPVNFSGLEQLSGGYLHCPYQNQSEIKKLFFKMRNEFTQKKYGHQNIVKGLIFEALGYLIRNNDALIKNDNINTAKIVKICKYVDENIHKPLNLKEVAKAAGYSHEHFSKLFKKTTGQTFKSYVDNSKMLMAKRLIIFEGLSVGDTARRLGYDDISTFCRAFKRLNGYAPSSLITKRTQ